MTLRSPLSITQLKTGAGSVTPDGSVMWFVLSEATLICAAAGSQRNKVANNSNRFMIILIFRLVGHASAGLRAVGRGIPSHLQK